MEVRRTSISSIQWWSSYRTGLCAVL